MGEECEGRITLKVRLLPVLVGLAMVFQLIAPYRGWMILLVGLGGALVTGYVWARAMADGLVLTREMRFGWAQVGDRVEERFTLSNESPMPALWVEVMDRSTMPGYEIDRVATLGGHDATRWRTGGTCRQRGVFTLGPTNLVSGDPLGIFRVELRYPTSMPFVVMPPIVSLPSIDVASGGRAGEGRPRANAPERTVSAAAVREYVPGDSSRWIHWRTSARRDSPYVRLFDGVPAGDWWILLDMNRRVQAGEGLDATDEHGVVLAASLADRGLRLGKQVGLAANGRNLAWLSPRGGEGQRWRILQTLALIRRGDHNLSHLLSQVSSAFGRDSSLIIITPDPSCGWVESLIPVIRRGIVPTVLLLDRTSFVPAARPHGGGKHRARQMVSLLSAWGIAHQVVGRDLLDRSEMEPGERGHWVWRVLGTGHAVPVRKPRDVAWRVVS